MLAEALLIQVGCALDFAEVVARALGVLVDLEWSLAALWHLGVHESRGVLLELSSLRLYFKLIIAEEGSSVLAVEARLCVDSGAFLSGSGRRRDLEASLSLLSTEEDGLVGLEGRALRFHFDVFAEKGGFIALESLAIHVGGHDAILHVLELVAEGIGSVELLALIATVEELACVHLVLRGRVADLVLEEPLLGLFECRVVAHVLGNCACVVRLALLAARLLELGVAELVHLDVVLTAVELGVGLHHRLLLVFGQVFEPTDVGGWSDTHLLGAGLGEG